MAHVGDLVGGAITILASLATMALGVLVLRLAPERPASRAFAALAILYGLLRLVPGLAPFLADASPQARLALLVALSPAGLLVGAMVWFASVHPRPRGLAARPWGSTALLVASYAASFAALAAVRASDFEGATLAGPAVTIPPLTAFAAACVAIVFARDARRGTPGAPLLAVAFAAYPAVLAGSGAAMLAAGAWDDGVRPLTLACGAAVLAVVALLPGSEARGARAGAVVLAAFLAASAAAATASGATALQNGGLLAPVVGVARFALPLLVAFALVRHRLFDLDVRIRWTLSRGTVAAVFLAVFFVVAQVAQEFLSETYGLMLGGVAAGLLLFAITPLQRVAERVADAAMPGVRDPRAVAAATGKEDAYRAALGMALADGVISRHEERALAKLQHELGIPAPRALDLREDVERDLAGT